MDPNVNTIKKRHTMGRRKIEIKKIEEKSSRQVTFSKRRTGLFKKASELCILSGAEAAIFVVSPKGKIFTFGHPSVEAIIARYMQGNNNILDESEKYFQSLGRPFCQFSEIMEQLRLLEAEKDRLKSMNSHVMPKDVFNEKPKKWNWWEKKIDGMNTKELEKFREDLEVLKKGVELRKAEEIGIKMSVQISGDIIDKQLEMVEEDVDSKALIIVPHHHDDYAFEFDNMDV